MIDQLIAGDTLDFVDTVAAYPASDLWTLKYRLVPQFTSPAQSPITLTASAEGDDYRVQAMAATTALWAAGFYSWARWVEKGAMRIGLGSGRLQVNADPATAVAGLDTRTHARKVLDAIEAVLENRATKDQEEYSIEGRSLKRTPLADLIALRSQYSIEVQREERAARAAAGLGTGRTIGVRFGRA
jgi:hypothetical protein